MENTVELRAFVAALEERFRRMGAALESEARSLREGMVPSNEMLLAMEAGRSEFFAARETIFRLAEASGVEQVGSRRLESTRDLLAVIDEMLLESERVRQRRTIAAALDVLKGVLEMEHRTGQGSTAMDACRAQARAARSAIQAAPSLVLRSDDEALASATAMATGDHPLAHLVLLVQGKAADDEHWEELRKSVTRSFGVNLARAAVEGRLVSRREQDGGSQAAKPRGDVANPDDEGPSIDPVSLEAVSSAAMLHAGPPVIGGRGSAVALFTAAAVPPTIAGAMMPVERSAPRHVLDPATHRSRELLVAPADLEPAVEAKPLAVSPSPVLPPAPVARAADAEARAEPDRLDASEILADLDPEPLAPLSEPRVDQVLLDGEPLSDPIGETDDLGLPSAPDESTGPALDMEPTAASNEMEGATQSEGGATDAEPPPAGFPAAHRGKLSAFQDLALSLGQAAAARELRTYRRERTAPRAVPDDQVKPPPSLSFLDVVEHEAVSEPPPWQVDAPYRYGFSAETTVSEIVRALGPDAGAHPPPAMLDLVWRLLLDDRTGAAYLVARYTHWSAPRLRPLLPPWLLRALAVANHIRQPTGAIADLLAGDLPALSVAEAPNRSFSWEVSVRLLVMAATLLPSLLAPRTRAPTVLLAACTDVDVPAPGVAAYGRIVGEYGELGHPVDPRVLRTVKDQASWDAELRDLHQAVREWWARAPSLSNKFVPATHVWQRWLDPNHIIHRLIEPVLGDDVSRLDDVRRMARRYADGRVIEKIAHTTDRQEIVRHGGRDIQGAAMHQLRKQVNSALQLAQRWVAIHERSPRLLSSGTERLSDLMRRLEPLHAAAREELEAMRDAHPGDVLLRVGVARCLAAVKAVSDLLDPSTEFREEHVTPQHLLHAEHLRVPGLVLDEQWELRDPAQRPRCRDGLLASLASASESWTVAFDGWRDLENNEATGWIIEHIERTADPCQEHDVLQARRQESIAGLRKTLASEIQMTEEMLDKTVGLGLISEKKHAEYAAQIQDVEMRQGTVLDFAAPRELLRSIRADISATLKNLQGDLLAQLSEASVDPRSAERIQEAIKADELLTASEYMHLLKAGSQIPIGDNATSAFQAFFPQIINAIEAEVRVRGVHMLRLAATEIRNRRSFAGIPMGQVPPIQADAAAEMVDAWWTLRRGDQIDPKLIRTILTHLGFADVACDPPQDNWVHVTTRVLKSREQCPVPAYGSAAGGRYRILRYRSRPSEDQILRDVGENAHGGPVIVFFLGILTEARRRSLGKLCREGRRTLLVVDSALILYLAGERSLRLPVLFRCALPFTLVEPYSSASGVVQPEMFYGRARERDSIIDPGGSCFIYGGRQLGKTALLRDVVRTFHAPAQGHIAVWVDLKTESVAQKHPINDIWRLIAVHLEQLGVLPHGPQRSPNDMLDAIERWLREDPTRRVLLLLDEADRFLEADGRDQFVRAAMLKGLMDRSDRRFKVVFAGLHNVKRSIRLANNPLAHYNDAICIGPLLMQGEVREARALVEVPFGSLGYRFQRHLVMRILSQTNYYPSLIQLYCIHLLRHLNEKARYPPYQITPQDLIEVYQRKELRDAIRDRFSLTLELDPRYEVIAYVIALAVSTTEGGMTEGYTVAWTLREAHLYWPEGFADSGDDVIATLLDEMVGLGVLRETAAHRYTLRSPNVLLLLGTAEQIEAQLHKSRTLQPRYDPATYHSSYKNGAEIEPSRRHPLTVAGEARLEQSRVAIVTGCEAAGLSELAEFVESSAGACVVRLLAGADLAHLHQAAASLAAGPAGRAVLVVEPVVQWDGAWVDAAAAIAATPGEVEIRFVFIADARITWQLSAASPSLLDPPADGPRCVLSLGPWHDDAVWFWLDDCGLRSSTQPRITEETGNWPLLLQALYEGTPIHHGPLEKVVDALRDALASPQIATEIAMAMGIFTDDTAKSILSDMAVLRSVEPGVSAEDLATVHGCDVALVERVFAWGARLGLVHEVGEDQWRLDTIVGRVLEAISIEA